MGKSSNKDGVPLMTGFNSSYLCTGTPEDTKHPPNAGPMLVQHWVDVLYLWQGHLYLVFPGINWHSSNRETVSDDIFFQKVSN